MKPDEAGLRCYFLPSFAQPGLLQVGEGLSRQSHIAPFRKGGRNLIQIYIVLHSFTYIIYRTYKVGFVWKLAIPKSTGLLLMIRFPIKIALLRYPPFFDALNWFPLSPAPFQMLTTTAATQQRAAAWHTTWEVELHRSVICQPQNQWQYEYRYIDISVCITYPYLSLYLSTCKYLSIYIIIYIYVHIYK